MPEEPSTNSQPQVCTIVIQPDGNVSIYGNIPLDALARIAVDIALKQLSAQIPKEDSNA